MISINYIQINSTADFLQFQVQTSVGNEFTQILIWDKNTYKNYSVAIDISSLISGTSNIETITVPATLLNTTKLTGIYFLEFKTNEIESNISIGVVANLIPYYNCLYSKLEKIDVSSCGEKTYDNCKDSDNEDTYYISSLLQTVGDTIETGQFDNTIKILNKLDDICGCSCDFPNSEVVGPSFKWGSDVTQHSNVIILDANGDTVTNISMNGNIVTINDLPITSCLSSLVTLVNAGGTNIGAITVDPGVNQIYTIADSQIVLLDTQGGNISSHVVHATANGTITAPDGSLLIKRTGGSTIHNLSILSNSSNNQVIQDSLVSINKSDGSLISVKTVEAASNTSYNVANSQIIVGGAYFSVKATEPLTIGIKDSLGDNVSTTIVGNNLIINQLPCSGVGDDPGFVNLKKADGNLIELINVPSWDTVDYLVPNSKVFINSEEWEVSATNTISLQTKNSEGAVISITKAGNDAVVEDTQIIINVNGNFNNSISVPALKNETINITP